MLLRRTPVQAPDGGTINVEHPVGASDDDILGFASESYSQDPSISKKAYGGNMPTAERALEPQHPAARTDPRLPYQQSPEGRAVAAKYGVLPAQLDEARAKAFDFGRHTVLPAVAPTVGAIAGGLGGGLVASPTVAGIPAGVLAGEMFGSMAGEGVNQALGITKPSAGQVAFAGVAPGIGRGIGWGVNAVKRAVAPLLPGAGAAMRDVAAKESTALGERLRPPVSSDVLYAKAGELNPPIGLNPVKKRAEELALEQAPRSQFGVEVPGGVGSVITKTRQALAPPKPSQSMIINPETNRPFVNEIAEVAQEPVRRFQDVRKIMRGINDKIGALKAQGGEGFGEMLQLKKSFAESLEHATASGSGEAYAALRAANQAYRQEIAADTITDIVRRNTAFLEGRETWNLAAGKTIKAIKEAVNSDPFLRDSFPKGSLENIYASLEKIRRLPVVGAPPGADAGSKRNVVLGLAGTALGGLFNAATGNTIPQYVAAPLGGVASIGAASLISKALMTPSGTKWLLNAATQPGVGLTRSSLGLLATGLRAETASTDRPPASIQELFTGGRP